MKTTQKGNAMLKFLKSIAKYFLIVGTLFTLANFGIHFFLYTSGQVDGFHLNPLGIIVCKIEVCPHEVAHAYDYTGNIKSNTPEFKDTLILADNSHYVDYNWEHKGHYDYNFTIEDWQEVYADIYFWYYQSEQPMPSELVKFYDIDLLNNWMENFIGENYCIGMIIFGEPITYCQ